MLKFILFSGILVTISLLPATTLPEVKWWSKASFYQIYVISFKDSNGDGVGDLNGITEKLDYLKEIGITAIWLSPIFESPMNNLGNDASDFMKIFPPVGTFEDFDKLIAKAKRLNIKINLNFVPNQTSNECDWFKKSVQNHPEYRDYYVWHEGKVINNVRQPPTNWISVYGGSIWQWNEQRQAYYLHQFSSNEPDLNFRNPKVRAAFKKIMHFWLDKGIDGFRMEAVRHIFEIGVKDEPPSSIISNSVGYDSLKHIYTTDQPEVINLLMEWRILIDNYTKVHGGTERILMTESFSSAEVLKKYYGKGNFNGAHLTFNYFFLTMSSKTETSDMVSAINLWLSSIPPTKVPSWALGSNDANRVSDRFGVSNIDNMNLLLLTLPGVSMTYQGEEIGMKNGRISYNDTQDPIACMASSNDYYKISRDPMRTPFQWSSDKNAGFSTANRTWLPVADNYQTINVQKQKNRPNSHLNLFKEFQTLRKRNTFVFGSTSISSIVDGVLIIKRALENHPTFIVLINFSKYVEFIDLTLMYPQLEDLSDLEYVVVNRRSQHNQGDIANPNSVLLMPKEAFVLQTSLYI